MGKIVIFGAGGRAGRAAVAEALRREHHVTAVVRDPAAGLEVLRGDGSALDWVYVSPAGDFDHEGGHTGRYDIRDYGDLTARISYADFALTLLDEAQAPGHHRSHLAVT
jgi:putative NADH-flavin reductase